MKSSYDSEQLINNVLDDIAIFGETFNVYAIYSYFERVDGRLIDAEFITDYVDADAPTKNEVSEDVWDTEDEADYQQLLVDYKAGLNSLKETKHKKMTLQELLQRLEKQDKIFED